MGGEPTSRRALQQGWLMTEPHLQCNPFCLRLARLLSFPGGKGLGTIWAFFHGFHFGKRAASPCTTHVAVTCSVRCLRIASGPPYLGHHLAGALSAAWHCEFAPALPAISASCKWALKRPVRHPTPASFFLLSGSTTLSFICPFPALWQALISLTHTNVNNAEVLRAQQETFASAVAAGRLWEAAVNLERAPGKTSGAHFNINNICYSKTTTGLGLS